MKIDSILENALLKLTDLVFAAIPRPAPGLEQLQRCKIVSHRGEHDNLSVKENTMPAFERVFEAGIWGIEIDIRWTKDFQPVVIHDADCRRVFGNKLVVQQLTLAELLKAVPQIPTLESVIQQFGGKMHLMIELKRDLLSDRQKQSSRLETLLGRLEPQQDFHIIALSADIFGLVDFLPGKAKLLVAEFNLCHFSRLSIAEEFGGVMGHYLLVTHRIMRLHQYAVQKTGTGFIRSKNNFYRELNRGVDWIFTNHALKLRSIRQRLLHRLLEAAIE